MKCTFCKFASGSAQCHTVWEDDSHLAFLSNRPNTDGFTVVITRDHLTSNVLALPLARLTLLMAAAQNVSKKLIAAFDDVGRVGLVAEGFGIDHAHVKLIPMHGTPKRGWHPILSSVGTRIERYEGYLSSHNGPEVDAQTLFAIAEKIRSAVPGSP